MEVKIMRKATEKEIKKEITYAYCRYCKKDHTGQFYCKKENKYFYPSIKKYYFTCNKFERYS